MKRGTPFRIGLLLLAVEIAFLAVSALVDSRFTAKILQMIAANHIGGRLPFITVGLENGLSPSVIIPFIMFYNTTYTLLSYSLLVFLSTEIRRFHIVHRALESLKRKAERRKKVFKKWSRIGVAVFVWVPLPWTGAAIGSYIAYLEGYAPGETFATVLPSMWVGVITWTLWFDELYEFIEKFGRGKTMLITVLLLVVPLVLAFINLLNRNRKREIKERS